ncbi:hypothetical protein [Methylosinus sp. KRF6]|uniref:hypothetical protein n=1 Tax=Methylosinus sp. KRF6 TaxID=2846853 RepID=UPI001C0BB159|nr:hypothetical protein [Methylosinus sp. KRF6]MBU3889850.1 hypothetical protein [Methylosinus sp. KRF6]
MAIETGLKEPSTVVEQFTVVLFRRPWWEKDPEVATYLRSIFGTMPVGQMPAAIAARFSPERAPAKSSIFRYMNVLRGLPPVPPKKKRRRGQRRTIPADRG